MPRLPARPPRVSLFCVGTLAWFAAGCAPRLADCGDPACRATAVEPAFRAAPLDTLTGLAALPDPVEQAALIEALMYAFPSQASAICRSTPTNSLAAERCGRLALRPHLFTDLAAQVAPRMPRRAGPSRELPIASDAPIPWEQRPADVAALRANCGQSAPCLNDEAMRRAEAGELESAGQLCALAWPVGSAVRAECVFQVAERLTLTFGAERLIDALAGCAGADKLAENCTQHVILLSIPPPTPADQPDPQKVAAMLELIGRLKGAASADRAAEYADLAWSVWTREAALRADAPSGRLLAVLPAAAAPHVRMAAAWRYALGHPNAEAGVREGVPSLKAAFADRGPVSASPSGQPLAAVQPRALWRWDRVAADADQPAAYALGAGRRLVSSDPDVDLQIALLEAYARLPEPTVFPALAALLGTDAPVDVRWTAARLAAELDLEAAKGLLGRDPDPRIDATIRAEAEARGEAHARVRRR